MESKRSAYTLIGLGVLHMASTTLIAYKLGQKTQESEEEKHQTEEQKKKPETNNSTENI